MIHGVKPAAGLLKYKNGKRALTDFHKENGVLNDMASGKAILEPLYTEGQVISMLYVLAHRVNPNYSIKTVEDFIDGK